MGEGRDGDERAVRITIEGVVLTAADIKFLLLHDTKAEEPIRQFFTEVQEVYVKCLMNPFYEVDMRITSVVFDSRVRAAARKYL